MNSGQYLDGDTVVLAATDGMDVNNTTVCAYSEDLQVGIDMELKLPSPYDFLLIALSGTDVTVLPGDNATFDVDVVNRGPLNNTIVLAASSAWAVRILDENGTAIS